MLGNNNDYKEEREKERWDTVDKELNSRSSDGEKLDSNELKKNPNSFTLNAPKVKNGYKTKNNNFFLDYPFLIALFSLLLGGIIFYIVVNIYFVVK